MFLVKVIQDSIHVSPINSNDPVKLERATRASISEKYANKIIQGHGLCITVHSIKQISEPIIHPGKMNMVVNTRFGMIFFAPVPGEIISGTVYNQTEKGFDISLGFFEGINIPNIEMTPDTFFDGDAQAWYWFYNGQRLHINRGSKVRVKILSSFDIESEQNSLIIASIDGDGLGPLEWWGL